jgi:hypothetical protein
VSATQKARQRRTDEEWDQQHHDLSVRWGTALVQRLQRHCSSLGLLSQADERRFQALCEELHTLSDLIDRFELTQQAGDRTCRECRMRS